MGRPRKTLEVRIQEFEEDGIYLTDENVVMCSYCDSRLNGDKKDTLRKHTQATSHMQKRFLSASGVSVTKRRSSPVFEEVSEEQKRSKVENDIFIEDTVNMFLKANIPLQKLEHEAVREYLEKYIPGSSDRLPDADTLKRKYVPTCGQFQKDYIKERLKNKPIAIVADETTDKHGRCVFAVLFKTIDAKLSQECFLASVNFLDTADASSCSQTIVDTLKDYEIDYAQIKGLISDSARHMSSCFNLLKILVGENILHYQCWIHKINNVGDVFVSEFNELSTIVTKVKSAFVISKKMKSSYLSYLKEKVPFLPPKPYPAPAVTRWNSWLTAVLYLNDYLDHIHNFFNEWENKNPSVFFFNEKYIDESFKRKLTIQISFISELCPKIMKLIDELEGSSYPGAHRLWNKLEDLKATLERQKYGCFGEKTSHLLLNNPGEMDCDLNEMLKTASEKSFNKLSLYMRLNSTNEAYYNIGQLFCPSVAASMTTLNQQALLDSFSKIPFFRALPQNKLIDGYTHFHRLMLQSINRNEDPNVMDILWATKCSFPTFAEAALQSIWSPTNSVDAERFFSKYNVFVTDKRMTQRESMLKMEQC